MFDHFGRRLPSNSGSQLGCRGTKGCHQIVLGLPPVTTFIDLKTYLSIYGYCQILIYLTKGAAREKRLRTARLRTADLGFAMANGITFFCLGPNRTKRKVRKVL